MGARRSAPPTIAALVALATVGGCAGDGQRPPVYELDAASVEETIRLVADHQLANPVARDPRHWSMAALYDGLIDASLATGDPRYLAAVIRTGRRIEFRLGSRTYHADGHAAGHAWLRLYIMDTDRDGAVLSRFVAQFDEIVENPIPDDLSFLEPPPPGRRRTDRWTWADALFMSPPTVTLLAYATGDEDYLRWLDEEFRFTYDKIYDREEHLFYRDETYKTVRSPSGKKVFWSRGNAWVYAGLAFMLDYLASDRETRPFYEGLFREMSERLAAAQQPDGFWYPNLVDPEHVPMGEVSGTALFVMGMAYGARDGLLDRATYRENVERGWSAVRSRIAEDGEVDAVQGFGEAPVPFEPASSATYGTGAVLMAGHEVLRALGAAAIDIDDLAELHRLHEEAEAMVDEVPNLTTICEDCVEP